MELFNKYKSKDFLFLINEINKYAVYDDKINKEKVISFFDETHSFKEIIDYISTKADDNLFNVSNNYLITKDKSEIPTTLSYYENAWLYDILCDEKAKLFLESATIENIKSILKEKCKNVDIITNHTYNKKLNMKKEHKYTVEEIKNFKNIMEAIQNHKYITLTNNAFTGKKYENSKLIPYKIEYNYKQDTFSLTCINIQLTEIIRIFFFNIECVRQAEKIADYENTLKQITSVLESKKSKDPITLKIENNQNVFQRCSYAFSNYEKITYENDNTLYMDITYYDFQKVELITSILQMGKYVKVTKPNYIVEEIKCRLENKAKRYNIIK